MFRLTEMHQPSSAPSLPASYRSSAHHCAGCELHEETGAGRGRRSKVSAYCIAITRRLTPSDSWPSRSNSGGCNTAPFKCVQIRNTYMRSTADRSSESTSRARRAYSARRQLRRPFSTDSSKICIPLSMRRRWPALNCGGPLRFET